MTAAERLPQPWRHPAFLEMRTRIEELEEESRQLKAVLVPVLTWPHAWRLTPQEGRLLAALYAGAGLVRKDRLLLALSPPGEERGYNVLPVYANKLRVKLRRFGVTITNIRGYGYELPPESRAAIAAAIGAGR